MLSPKLEASWTGAFRKGLKNLENRLRSDSDSRWQVRKIEIHQSRSLRMVPQYLCLCCTVLRVSHTADGQCLYRKICPIGQDILSAPGPGVPLVIRVLYAMRFHLISYTMHGVLLHVVATVDGTIYDDTNGASFLHSD